MTTITPFLWFPKGISEIIDYYKSIFPDMEVQGGGKLENTPSGSIQMVTLTIFGQKLQIMAAGSEFPFTEAVSFVVSCKDQAEVDYYWGKFTAEGSESQCGWCKDKYGLSWQVTPARMEAMMREGTPEQVQRVTQAFMPMKKLDLATLEKAYNGTA